eukprot:g5604.t1
MPGLRIKNTPIVVDTFQFFEDDVMYFLTHAHSDHTNYLREGWNNGIIYCTELTRRFVLSKFKLNPKIVIPLELGQTSAVCLPNSKWFTNVTLIDANHCPGAVMFLFEGSHIPGGTILHTGDFRFCKTKMLSPLMGRQIDTLYLDNTYLQCNEKFPTRESAVQTILSIISDHAKKRNAKESFFHRESLPTAVIGVHTIGKEDLLRTISDHFHIRLRVSTQRLATLKLGFGGVHVHKNFVDKTKVTEADVLAEKRNGLCIYISNIWELTKIAYHKWNKTCPTIFIAPTGQPQKLSFIYRVPYSLHSSRQELLDFVALIKPRVVRAGSFDSFDERIALANAVEPLQKLNFPSQQTKRQRVEKEVKLQHSQKLTLSVDVSKSLAYAIVNRGGHNSLCNEKEKSNYIQKKKKKRKSVTFHNKNRLCQRKRKNGNKLKRVKLRENSSNENLLDICTKEEIRKKIHDALKK